MNRKREISTLLQKKKMLKKAYQHFLDLGEYLKTSLQGEHVSVIFVSGGINVAPGRQYYEIVNKVADRLALSLNSPEFALQMPRSNREPNFDLRSEIKKSIGVLSRENITVYCINARGSMNPGLDQIGESKSRLHRQRFRKGYVP